MAEKQGVPSAPAPKYERGFLTPEQEKKVSPLGLGAVEGIAELLNPYPMNVETGERELAAPGLFEGIASAGKAIAGAIKDPVGTYEKVSPALEQIGDRMMQAPGLAPGQMAFVDGELRPLTSEEVVQERIESGMDPTIALTGAAPIAARTARAGVAGLMPEPGVVSLFGSAERVPERQAAALKLKAEGVPEQKIFEQTGVFYGDDGLLRFEIDDRKAKFKGGFSVDENGSVTFDDIPKTELGFIDSTTKQKPVTLGDILDHEELYKYYPEAKDIPVKDVPFLSFSEGAFDPIDEVLMVRKQGGERPPKEAVKELELTLLHELQHYLQYKHDFDTGGAKKQFLPKDYDAVRGYVSNELESLDNVLRGNGVNPMGSYRLEADMSTIQEIDKRIATQGPLDPEIDKFTIEDYNSAKDRVNSFRYSFDNEKQFDEYLGLLKAQDNLRAIDAEAFNAYKRLSGEVEARQVEFRKDFPTEEEVAAGADDYSRLKPFSGDEFVEMERVETPDPRLIGDAIPSPASGNRSKEYAEVSNSIKNKFQEALDAAGYSDQKAVDKATRIEGFDYGMDDKSVQKFRAGGIVAAKPSVRGNSGIADVIRKYRREGMMD